MRYCAYPVILVAIFSAAAFGQDCVRCHEQELDARSVHTDMECADCHTNIESTPHPEMEREALRDDQLCAQCHRTIARRMWRSVHARALRCSDCHGLAHSILPTSHLESPMFAANQAASCGGCHQTDDGLIERYHGSVHAKALGSGSDLSAASCSDCHGSHNVLPTSDPHSATGRDKVAETCGICHPDVTEDWLRVGAHGRAWEAGADAPVCTTCHTSHEIMKPSVAPARLKFPEECGGCHGDLYSSFRDSFHGQATYLGFIAAAICSDCHTPHRNLPASDPESSVHPSQLADTCGACHGAVSAAFVSFDPHSDPTDPERSRQVYITWMFMTALLVGVFGFFGIHDSLWLQRSLVAVARGELQHNPAGRGRYVRRFKKAHIWVHVVIVITFLLLAATGLPLKYHNATWAQPLIQLFGGVEIARSIHRIAALGTFGYALFHLSYLFYHVLVQRKRGYFWGPDSLVPQPRDFAELWTNLKYFLYIGRRPVLDRWTYWEKFDYLAVFWGVVIIGVSGLMLWVPDFVTLFLPGWTLNAAHVVHSDEALLATGFIFVFHFFHTHVRPESFPMDPVIFTGRISLERFKEERPLEHQRLVEECKLDEYLVDPPTHVQIALAYLFGLIAVAIGLTLAIGIFVGASSH